MALSTIEQLELQDIRRELENALMRVNRMIGGFQQSRLVLVSFPDNLKINIIKCIRAICGLGLKEAKAICDLAQSGTRAEILRVPNQIGFISVGDVTKHPEYVELARYATVVWE